MFVIAHWGLAGLAVYQRGGLSRPFHFTWEPFLFQLIVLSDLIWISLSESCLIPSVSAIFGEFITDQGTKIGVGIVLAAFQWFAIGCLIDFFRTKKLK